MHMPKAKGFTYIAQARCLLSSYAKYAALLRKENGKTLANFIHRNILCRWGIPLELVTDNSTSYVAAAKELQVLGFHHITISAYNS